MGDGPVIPVIWLGGHPVSWDQAMLDDALSGRMWPVGYEFHHVPVTNDVLGLPEEPTGAIVIVHGPMYADKVDIVNKHLAAATWVLVCVTSDEERRFPIEKLSHPNMALWLQYPQQTDQADAYLPVGYPPHFRALLPHTAERTNDWVFAGQVNHSRRRELVDVLRDMDGGVLHESPGFSQGLRYSDYAHLLSTARVVPCPSGPKSVDSFRVWETLEAGAVPMVDGHRPGPGGARIDSDWLWGLVLGGPVPFLIVDDWTDFPDLIDLPRDGAGMSAWWQTWKRSWCRRIGDTIHRLSGIERSPDPVTVLIPTSPIATHPDATITEMTLASARHWLPDAEIIVMCDGVRAEQEHYRAGYTDYLQSLAWLAARDGRIQLTIHDKHLHQAEMTRRALDLVTTPLVLFVEHDTPLVTDEPMDWPALTAAALSGDVDLVRFHYEAHVHPEHEHLMLDQDPHDICGAPLLRTVQWSQRPHLAGTGFYRRLLAEHFPAGHVGMLEDQLHGVVHNAWREYGLAGWDRYRLWMYAPPGQIKRSLHLDGRGDDRKWEFG